MIKRISWVQGWGIVLMMTGLACNSENLPQIQKWFTYEIVLQAQSEYSNPYTEVDVTGVFTNHAGDTLSRPAFWDGGLTWKIRFAPPDTGPWIWMTRSSNQDPGLHQQQGRIRVVPYQGKNALLQEGLFRMSPGKRNVIHASGKSFLVIGDTPWALPFRATVEQAKLYAQDRQSKGFNSALLMTVQPDMLAEGPESRDTKLGFARGFEDLADGHINKLNPAYFQYLDSLTNVLIDHHIVPVYQPVFHGFGWKGKQVLGNYIDPEEYVRYCKYLLARYGSKPAMWLIAGDNGGKDPGVKEAGEMLEEMDGYGQPTGLHYNPCDDYVAEWAINNPLKHCEHYNRSFQDQAWLDFQWAQTGHNGEHLYHKVERMYKNLPIKANANGEPTYEGMNEGKNGLGWWQGEEAWMQLMSGGTMGVVYGAAGLWQWKVTSDEPGWTAWASQPKSWREAMDMEGSTYVGLVGRILEGLDLTDIEKRWEWANGQPLLAKRGELYISYTAEGDLIQLPKDVIGMQLSWVNPKTGKELSSKKIVDNTTIKAPDQQPWVLIIQKHK